MNRWCFAFALALLLGAPVAHAGSITSFEPDTTSARARPAKDDPAVVAIVPIWLGAISSLGVLHVSDFGPEQKGSAAPVYLGASATWPWSSARQSWLEAHYERFRFRLPPRFVSQPIDSNVSVLVYTFPSRQLDQFAVRWGVEQRVGALDRPFLTIGAGIGYATGFSTIDGDERTALSLQALGRVTLFVYAGRSTRFGLGLEAGPNWTTLQNGGDHAWNHAEINLRVESMLRLPRRIIPPAPDPTR